MGERADKPKIVVVQGPTASGKSALAMEVAERFDGEIVNADSVQMVKGFDIGSAKPTLAERAEIPHHLFDVVSADEPLDVGIYRKFATKAIDAILSRGKLPVVVGGTGLYVRALLGGLIELPPANQALRSEYEQILKTKGVEALWRRLASQDDKAKNHIDKANPRRVVRALEILELTGKPIWQWKAEHRFCEKPYDAYNIAIIPAMDKLTARIEKRTKLMLEAGLIEEVQGLLAHYQDDTLKPFGSIGYRQVVLFLKGILDEEQLISEIVKATRRYAKKQCTWLKREEELGVIEDGKISGECEKIYNHLK